MMNPFFLLIVRHAMMAAGAILVRDGIVTEGAVNEIATQGAEVVANTVSQGLEIASGVALAAGSIALSAYDKVKNGIFGLFGKPKTPSQLTKTVAENTGKNSKGG
jgi:hypothetical protein